MTSKLNNAYFRLQSLEYINEATWRVTLEPEELGEVTADWIPLDHMR